MSEQSKQNTKLLTSQKHRRRQWITFLRMCRYGINNISRNAWLTIAATAVMTITLLVVFMTLSARSVLIDTVDEIRDKVDMSIYVKTETSQGDIKIIQTALENMSSVRRVSFISPSEARSEFAEDNKQDKSTLEALNEATNQFPGTFRINPVDINNTEELKNFVENNQTLKNNIDPNREPSFAGDRKSAIENIGRWIEFAERIGLIASIIFVGISSLIVFNTIRMAIFNRKDEIQMMKLIGANSSFIRGPFVVEAIVYGFIAAVIATGIGVAILYFSSNKLLDYGVSVDNLMNLISTYLYVVIIGMVMLGSMIGVISSLLATRKYLKI